MLSIIIPTLNEENYLEQLLQSIRNQGFSDLEIIVADAGSKDRTLAIAKNYQCRVVEGGLPARGRNSGAAVARGEILFFLDADTVLPAGFLEKSLKEFSRRNLDIAGFYLTFKDKNHNFTHLDKVYNKFVVALEKVMPFTVIGVFVKKEVYEEINGYDEALKISEDTEFGLRAVKAGAKFGIIRSGRILISDRRFKKDGWFTTIAKYILSGAHTALIGPVTSDIFNYKFDHYKEGAKKPGATKQENSK